MVLNIASVLERNEKDFLANAVGEEMVIMEIKSGNYIGLNPVGAHIWKLLDKPATVSTLVGQLMQVYNVDEDTCLSQTLEYLVKMHTYGMVQIQSA
jgi:hypothetical protein